MKRMNNERQQTINYNKFSRYMPVLDEVTNDSGDHLCYLLDGGFLGGSFLCPPLSGASMKLLTALDSLFRRTYPNGSFLQIALVASDNIADLLRSFHLIRGKRMRDVGPFDMDEQGAYQAKFFEALSQQTLPGANMEGVPLRHFEVWVSIKHPIKNQKPTEDEILRFLDERNQLQETLKKLMGYAELMNPEILTHRLQMLHNPSSNARWRKGLVPREGQGAYRPSQPIRSQVLENGSEVDINKSSLVFRSPDGAERHVKSVSIQEFADTVSFGDLHEIVVDWLEGKSALRGNFIINLNIEFAKDDIKKKFAKRRTTAKQLGEGPWARWISALRYKLADFNHYEHYINREKAQHCRFHLNFFTMGKDEVTVEKNTRNLLTRIEERGWSGIEDHNIMLVTWLNMLPMGPDKEAADFVERYDMVPSNLLKFFVPMMASWQGNTQDNPVVVLIGRDGQIISFDPYTSETNYNMFVTATSGSGKSFFANYLIENILSTGRVIRDQDCDKFFNGDPQIDNPRDGGRMYIIDSGRSYVKLCELMGGQFVEVRPDETFEFNLNPFKTIEERFIDEVLTDESGRTISVEPRLAGVGPQGEMLLNILKLMAFPMGECDSYQYSQMSVIMCNLWSDYGNKATIDIFADKCAEHPNESVRMISDQLTPWCRTRNGQNGWMFNEDNPPIQFEKNLVILELDGLNGSDQVKAVTIMLCIQRIQQEMFSHDPAVASIRKGFLLDEAWEMLKDEKGADKQTMEVLKVLAKFLESGWRRFRKYNSLGCCISQSIRDATESPAGIAMATNSAHMLYLRQNEEEMQAFKSEGRFSSDIDFKLLESVHPNPPHYSEVMIRTNGAQEIGRIYAPRAKGLVYTTKPEEKNQIAAYQNNEGMELWAACCTIADDEGKELVYKKEHFKSLASGEDSTRIVTVLYLVGKRGDELRSKKFTDLPIGRGGRVILPDDLRANNKIVAVLEGEVDILNRLGERTATVQSVA